MDWYCGSCGTTLLVGDEKALGKCSTCQVEDLKDELATANRCLFQMQETAKGLSADLARVTAEREVAQQLCTDAIKGCDQQRARAEKAERERAALQAEVARLREALKPFANPEDLEDCRIFDEPPDEECDCAWCRVKAALAPRAGEEKKA